MTVSLLVRATAAAAFSIASHANLVFASSFSSSSVALRKKSFPRSRASFLSAFAISPTSTNTKRTSRNYATQNLKNNQLPQIGKRSTCRKPNYLINYYATPNQNSETATPVKTPYTIDDTVCPPIDPEKLQKCIEKHWKTLDKYLTMKPIAKHTLQAFEIADEFVNDFFGERGKDGQCGIIIDSGCGTARSTIQLAKKYPHHLVIGVDRSLVRLSRNAVFRKQKPTDGGNQNQDTSDDSANNNNGDDFINDKSVLSQSLPNLPNVLILRAELSDFWRCILRKQRESNNSKWNIVKHYLLYPNPYPKASRLKSRWYAHPAFPLILQLLISEKGQTETLTSTDAENCNEIVVRSNWKGYLTEFAASVNICRNLFQDERNIRNVDDNVKILNVRNFDEIDILGPLELKRDDLENPMTNFEKKFIDWGEPVFELRVSI